MSSSNEEEIEMILSMFSDECERYEGTEDSLLVHLPFRFELQVTLPRRGYPEESYPQLFLLSSPNAQLHSLFSEEAGKRMRESIPLGIPMLAMLIPLAQTVAEELKESRAKEAEEATEDATYLGYDGEDDDDEFDKQQAEQFSDIVVWSGDVIVDRRSRFVAHMAPVHSIADVRRVVNYVRSFKQIACAAHPAIYAYRFTDDKGMLHQDTDDDGESGASIKMAFLMDQLKVDGYVVIVTRWWGGTLLGPDRFKHIMEVTKNILLTIPSREAKTVSEKESSRQWREAQKKRR